MFALGLSIWQLAAYSAGVAAPAPPVNAIYDTSNVAITDYSGSPITTTEAELGATPPPTI